MQEQEDYKRFTFNYGIVMFRTKKGLSIMESLGKRKITKPLAWIMLYLLPISGGLALALLIEEFLVYLSPKGVEVVNYVASSISPTANLLIPGLNPYVPVLDGWIAIVTAVVIHEASHGIVARSLGLRVKTAGVLFLLFIPIGAFVEVDDKEMREVKVSKSMRVLAAGSGINFIAGLICMFFLIWSVSAMAPLANGSAIASVTTNPPSPASKAGIVPGDFITAIDGVSNNDLSTLNLQPYQVVNITIWHDGTTTVLHNVQLGEIIYTNEQTHQNTTEPYLGVGYYTYGSLVGYITSYSSPLSEPPIRWVEYLIPPAFPNVGGLIPFSSQLSEFYTSPLGPATNAVQNLLFWLFFVNFNLAIFNNLPIYPMDGGQALERFIVGVGRGKIRDKDAASVTTVVTLLLVVMLVSVVAGPYLYVHFFG